MERLKQLAEGDSFASYIGAEWVDDPSAKDGDIVLRLVVAPHHLNMHGTCHGGVIFALADAAFGIASNAHAHISVALDAHITFSTAVREGEVLEARALELTRTRRTGTYRVDVTKSNGGPEGTQTPQPVSQFTGTVFVTEKPSPL